jgi:hypothetical protein
MKQRYFWKKNFEDVNCPSTGLLQPCMFFITISQELSLIFIVKTIEKYLAFDPFTWSKSQVYSRVNSLP